MKWIPDGVVTGLSSGKTPRRDHLAVQPPARGRIVFKEDKGRVTFLNHVFAGSLPTV